MTEHLSQQKVSTATRTYVLALTLVATLSALAYVTMHAVISSQSHKAAVINVSGRQRMLSQRMALYSEYFVSGRAEAKAETSRILTEATDLFESSHRKLSKGSADLDQPIPQVSDIYSEGRLNEKAAAFVQSSRELMKTDDLQKKQELLSAVRSLQNEMLPLLDRVVSLNQAESDEQTAKLKEVDTVIFVITLVLLMVEAIFIFRPMIQSLARLIQNVREERDRAVSATDQKSAFLATVTHEIRTPLTGIMGITELLIAERLEPGVQSHLQTLKRTTDSLVGLVNDILDYSKIEAGQLSMEDVDFGLLTLIGDTESLFQPAAKAKGIEFVVHRASELPSHLRGDPTRLRQVVTNFVGNALKFTPSGGRVELSFISSATASGATDLRIEVKDSGPGLSIADQAKLFVRYSQADSSVQRKYGGTGLGLSICRQIANLMGGEVGVVSTLGSGATFWFEATFKSSSAMSSVSRTTLLEDPRLIGRRVLIVEDDDVIRKVLRAQFERMKVVVVDVPNGTEALAIAAKQTFDMIFMDCEMPDINGFDAAIAIRHFDHSTPIVALTGHREELVRDRCAQSGMNGVLTKPTSQQQLAEALLSASRMIAKAV